MLKLPFSLRFFVPSSRMRVVLTAGMSRYVFVFIRIFEQPDFLAFIDARLSIDMRWSPRFRSMMRLPPSRSLCRYITGSATS